MAEKNNVVPLRANVNDVNYLLRLRDSLNRITYTNHAKERMEERKVTALQVMECLKSGVIEEPAHEDIKGNWKATLVYLVSGDRIKVCAAIVEKRKGDIVIVVTVIK